LCPDLIVIVIAALVQSHLFPAIHHPILDVHTEPSILLSDSLVGGIPEILCGETVETFPAKLPGEVFPIVQYRSQLIETSPRVATWPSGWSSLTRYTTIENGTIIQMGTSSGIGRIRQPTRIIRDKEEMWIWFQGISTLVNAFNTSKSVHAAMRHGRVSDQKDVFLNPLLPLLGGNRFRC